MGLVEVLKLWIHSSHLQTILERTGVTQRFQAHSSNFISLEIVHDSASNTLMRDAVQHIFIFLWAFLHFHCIE